MKKLVVLGLLTVSSFANAELVTAENYTYALLDGKICDVARIPDAAQGAVDAAIAEAKKMCPNPKVLAARILGIEPRACRSWTAGFYATAEVEFTCIR